MKREHFDAWLKEPVTQEIFTAVRKAAEQERAEWVRQSWDAGQADLQQLIELRTRAQALLELVDNNFETWERWNGNDATD